MVKFSSFATAVAATSIFLAANAHPGHSIEEEIAERVAYLKRGISDLDHCAEKLRARGHEKRSIGRRVAKIQELRDEVAHKKSELSDSDMLES